MPNVESLLVTLDGVAPSDGTTTNLLITINNTIEFTTAPASEVEIQIRHVDLQQHRLLM